MNLLRPKPLSTGAQIAAHLLDFRLVRSFSPPVHLFTSWNCAQNVAQRIHGGGPDWWLWGGFCMFSYISLPSQPVGTCQVDQALGTPVTETSGHPNTSFSQSLMERAPTVDPHGPCPGSHRRSRRATRRSGRTSGPRQRSKLWRGAIVMVDTPAGSCSHFT